MNLLLTISLDPVTNAIDELMEAILLGSVLALPAAFAVCGIFWGSKMLWDHFRGTAK